jgi:predicted dehydrogenase
MDDLTSRPIRWGIASTGTIAHQMVEALRTIADADVVAVGSRRQQTADEFAERHGIGRAHGSYEALFADEEVDVVYIASPHSAHRAMTVAALDAGRHVLCEKAFAHNAAEARDMIEAARRNQRFLMEAMWTWFIPAVEEVKRRVVAGEIGRVRLFDATFGIRQLDPDGRHRRADLAGGSLLDLGVYPLSWARFLLGEPQRVTALATLTEDGVDDNLAGVVQFESGALATFTSSLEVRTSLRGHVYGTDGHIEIEAPFHHPTSFTISRASGEVQRIDIPNLGLAHEARHVMARIRAGELESDVIPLATSLSTMELMDEIRGQIGVTYPVER